MQSPFRWRATASSANRAFWWSAMAERHAERPTPWPKRAKLAITGRNLDRVRALAKACDAEALSREQAQTGCSTC